MAVEPARVDESAVKAAMAEDGADAEDTALMLASMKADRVSRRRGDALVIGADQVLDLEGRWFDKPADMDEARESLRALRGRTHRLVTAVCVTRDGDRIWHRVETPRLAMREFSDAFLDHYLRQAGESVLSSVGAYRLEGSGVQLFSEVEGSYFTILGLPLIPLLDFLRGHGVGMT